MIAREFIKLLLPRGQKKLAEAFALWKKNLRIARKDDLAELFYENRAAKFMLRRCFDNLRVVAGSNAKKNMKSDWLIKVRDNQLLRQCFTDLSLYAKKKVKLNQAWAISVTRSQ